MAKQYGRWFVSLLAICLFFRIYFYIATQSIAIEPTHLKTSLLAFGLVSDFLACLSITLIIASLSYCCQLRENAFKWLAFMVFFIFAILYLLKVKVYASLYMGINYTLLKVYLYQGASALSLFNYLSMVDCLILLSVSMLYLGLYRYFNKTIFYSVLSLYTLIIILGAVSFLGYQKSFLNERLQALYSNPMNQILTTYFSSNNQFDKIAIANNVPQQTSVQLIDPAFGESKPLIHSSKVKKDWNIVIFILESVGKNDIFKEIGFNTIPMPFLKSLSTQGAWFDNHYSTGNISALGQFGILTGIYPNPTPVHFELQNDLYVPTIPAWLGKNYQSFLVSASNNLYQALGLMRFFNKYDSAETLQPKEKLFFNMFMDENIAFNDFYSHLEKTQQPFMGVYWSTATHFPYQDYSHKIAIISNPQTAHDRYLNSLFLLDQEIKQTFTLLKQRKLLKNTIFIVIGDHGELFGEHGFYVHGRSLYNDETKVPLLIYAPDLIKPQVINETTSSIDLAPTLFDALGISYRNELQGESLLKRPLKRKYTFIYGDEDDLASIDKHNQKMIISFSNDTCQSFDLNKDPAESKPLLCTNEKQKMALLKFRHYQPDILNWYNRLCRSNSTCF